ncbi:MAG: hypothetical protein R3E86_10385 [Pseudomonadales bacterium]
MGNSADISKGWGGKARTLRGLALSRAALLAALMLTAAAGHADYCADRVGAALGELEGEGALQSGGRAQAEQVLLRLCADARGQSVAQGNVGQGVSGGDGRGTAPADAGSEASSDEPARLFGIEFEKAEPDSKGHARLKKTH